jgi:hypothetical protein
MTFKRLLYGYNHEVQLRDKKKKNNNKEHKDEQEFLCVSFNVPTYQSPEKSEKIHANDSIAGNPSKFGPGISRIDVENVAAAPTISFKRLSLPPSKSFPTHHSWIILLSQSKLHKFCSLTTSINNLRIY